LAEAGYVEGKNVALEYRWANEHFDRLPQLASELVQRDVAVIVTTGGNVPVQAAKAATSNIPIVFAVGGDPVQAGLVSQLSGSGTNVTGVTFFNTNLMPKRLEIMREAVANASIFAMLMNSSNPRVEPDKKEMHDAAAAAGVRLRFVYAAGTGDPQSAFEEITREDVQAVLVHPDAVLYNRIKEIVEFAAQHKVPTIYNGREVVALGGLISYGPDIVSLLRQAGVYTGRILKGEKPGDLPVQQPTKFELAINLKSAKALGITMPATLVARADEVIE
jgi:putative ABC transport system substrate-binding protein